MTETTITFTIIGLILILSGFLSLIYQFFSSSTLTLAGIVCLNMAWHWFHWNWLIWFAFLWLVAISCGFIITAAEGKKALSENGWLPVIGAFAGAIFIPIPFFGALIGVFLGSLLALCMEEPKINREKINLAFNITFKSFLGLIMEIGAVISMLITTLFLALF
ncbi:MAG: DUF456 family protein [Candidatus Caenarcaniphilales bacterium]|nr:DUF456 family protein [Candidatus Caenarcaniphilales bacterium]